MQLEFSGTQVVAASQQRVWERLLDHEFVGSCAPGIEAVEPVDEHHFKVIARFGVGQIRLRFALDAELSSLSPPNSARLTVRGKAPGSAVDMGSGVNLLALDHATTNLEWFVQSRVHGKVASVGARLLKSTSGKLAAGFWEEFARRVGGDA